MYGCSFRASTYKASAGSPSYRFSHLIFGMWCGQPASFDTYLKSVIDIGACICSARVNHLGQSLVGPDLVADADRSSRYWLMLIRIIVNRYGIVKRHVTGNGRIVIDVVQHRRASCPEDDGVRVRVSRSHTVSEVQLRRSIGSGWVIALVDLVDGDAQTRVVIRRTPIIEVVGIGCSCNAGQGQEVQKLEHGRGYDGVDAGWTEYCLRRRRSGSVSDESGRFT